MQPMSSRYSPYLDLPPVPEGHVAVDELDWSPGSQVEPSSPTFEEDLRLELARFAELWQVKLEVRQLAGPASLLPTVRMSGRPANVLRALMAYTGALDEETLQVPHQVSGSGALKFALEDALETFEVVYDFGSVSPAERDAQAAALAPRTSDPLQGGHF